MLNSMMGSGAGIEPSTVMVSLLLSYVLAQTVAAVYAWTHPGTPTSRTMIPALVVAGIVAAMLMLSIGNSLARGIGIVGTLALIRFRTNLREPLDMIFVLAAFGAGIASGTQSHMTAVLGTIAFVVVTVFLRLSRFGSFAARQGVARIKVPRGGEESRAVETVLKELCARFSIRNIREATQGQALDIEYRVTLKDTVDEVALLNALLAVPGARGVSLSVGSEDGLDD
jgi:hypothetical protein